MKKLIKGLLGLVLVVGIGCGALVIGTHNATGGLAQIVDRYNPLVPAESVYIKTTDPQSVNGFGTAHYKQTAVNAAGKSRTIEFDGLQKLRTNYYVKLDSKGAYVSTYEKVDQNAVPAAALQVLQ